ncbi:MAG TPA: DUF167 domain-containing protein [Dehalococcoidia bacterium]|nr:DUF167 domain-containing protein [Dehalococcoidia bacterium]
MKIRVKVTPNSKVEELIREGDDFLVRVKEPPTDGKANKAVIRLLAEHFRISQDSVRILSGFRSRNKVIQVLETQTS